MKMTPELVAAEARRWPREQVSALVDRLTMELHHVMAPENEEAWRQESRRRLEELETGKVQPISGKVVSDNIRRIVGR